jgi:hypothetical protein
VIGVFTTRKYEDAAALRAGEPFEVVESRNAFTNVGLEWMWKTMTGQLRTAEGTMTDHLGSARIVVGNGDSAFDPNDTRLSGDQTAQAELDAGYPTITGLVSVDDESEGMRLSLRATFGEQDAAFDWQERGVVTAQGVLLDRSVRDQGRKVLGAVWQLQADLILDR